jgi:hypothetical protein
MIGSSGHLSAFEGKLREAPDHHPVTAVLQRQDHLGEALELLLEATAEFWPVNLVKGRLAEKFALEC